MNKEFDLEAFRTQVEEALTTHEGYLMWLHEYRESVTFAKLIHPIRDYDSLFFRWLRDTFEESFSWFADQGESPVIEMMLFGRGGQQTFEVPRWVQMLVICEEQREVNTKELTGSWYSYYTHRAMIEQIATLLYGPLAGYAVTHTEEEVADFTTPHVSHFDVCIAHGHDILSDWDMNYTELHEIRESALKRADVAHVCGWDHCDWMIWLPSTGLSLEINGVSYQQDRIRDIGEWDETSLYFWYAPQGPHTHDPLSASFVQVAKKSEGYPVAMQLLKERALLVAQLKKAMEETK